jgi:hypothetical protein
MAHLSATPGRVLRFATLGPSGSNHQLVTQRYIEFHSLPALVDLVLDFDHALVKLLDATIDHIVQVAVHPATAATTAKHFRDIFVIDAFVCPSHPMGVLTRRDVADPKTLGLQPATREYVDTSRWTQLIPETSIATVAEGLLTGRFDSGITALEVAETNPELLRVDEIIGPNTDAWLVYGREPVNNGEILAWRESPAAALYERELKAKR